MILDPHDQEETSGSGDSAVTHTGNQVELLPVNGATLASDARVLETARALGTRVGADYLDDAAVSALLAERRRALAARQRGPLAWIGALAMVLTVLWPMSAPLVPALSDRPALAFGPAGVWLVLAVATLTAMRVRWKRELLHPWLAGYRQLLGLARAHGLPLTHVPYWLEGRSPDGTGKGAAPIPSYPKVEPVAEQAAPGQPSQAQPSTAPTTPVSADPATPVSVPPKPVSVPPKPATVASYEAMADEGGWHDEAGCLLIAAGGGGALWAATSDAPVGYLAPVLLVPLAISVWVSGSRQGAEKERLRQEALAYVRQVAAAQAAGARVPELSPALRKLLEE
jgi:hypothetical protein